MSAENKGDRLLSTRELAEKLDYSYGHTRNLLSEGKLPLTPVRLHDGAQPKWRESEVDAWIEERAAEASA